MSAVMRPEDVDYWRRLAAAGIAAAAEPASKAAARELRAASKAAPKGGAVMPPALFYRGSAAARLHGWADAWGLWLVDRRIAEAAALREAAESTESALEALGPRPRVDIDG